MVSSIPRNIIFRGHFRSITDWNCYYKHHFYPETHFQPMVTSMALRALRLPVYVLFNVADYHCLLYPCRGPVWETGVKLWHHISILFYGKHVGVIFGVPHHIVCCMTTVTMIWYIVKTHDVLWSKCACVFGVGGGGGLTNWLAYRLNKACIGGHWMILSQNCLINTHTTIPETYMWPRVLAYTTKAGIRLKIDMGLYWNGTV